MLPFTHIEFSLTKTKACSFPTSVNRNFKIYSLGCCYVKWFRWKTRSQTISQVWKFFVTNSRSVFFDEMWLKWRKPQNVINLMILLITRRETTNSLQLHCPPVGREAIGTRKIFQFSKKINTLSFQWKSNEMKLKENEEIETKRQSNWGGGDVSLFCKQLTQQFLSNLGVEITLMDFLLLTFAYVHKFSTTNRHCPLSTLKIYQHKLPKDK